MARWFKLSEWGKRTITPVEVIKETPEFVVWIQEYLGKPHETKTRKAGEFFPTFEEARAYLVEDLERKLQRLDDERSRVIGYLKDARNMPEI